MKHLIHPVLKFWVLPILNENEPYLSKYLSLKLSLKLSFI